MVCFGELLIDFVPTVGGLSLADAPAFKKAPGGAPANVAVGIAKLGGNAAFIGKVSCYYSMTRIDKHGKVYWTLHLCLCHALADISSLTFLASVFASYMSIIATRVGNIPVGLCRVLEISPAGC